MHCILYLSSAVESLSEADIDHLLERARTRNRDADVTGILLHEPGTFMQYIEGPRDGLTSIHDVIKKSPLHAGIVELINEACKARYFPQWSMAYRRTSVQAFTHPEQFASLLAPGLKFESDDFPAALKLLNRFWNGWTKPL